MTIVSVTEIPWKMLALTLLTGVDSLLVLVLTVRFSVSPPWLLPSW